MEITHLFKLYQTKGSYDALPPLAFDFPALTLPSYKSAAGLYIALTRVISQHHPPSYTSTLGRTKGFYDAPPSLAFDFPALTLASDGWDPG